MKYPRIVISILIAFAIILFYFSNQQKKKQQIDFQINGKDYSLGKHYSEMNIPEKDIWLNTDEAGVNIPIADLRDSSENYYGNNVYGIYVAEPDSIPYYLHIRQHPLPDGTIEIKSGGEVFSYHQDSLHSAVTFLRNGYLFKIEMSEPGSFLVKVEEEIDSSKKQR